MKHLIFLLACASVCFSSPVPATVGSSHLNEPVPIVSMESEMSEGGKYHYSFETGDGIKAHQEGELKFADKENGGEIVQGEYSYESPEGEKVAISYVADETGYHPSGSHIPVPPPIPEAIARALRYIEEHPYVEEESHKGKVL